MSSRIIRAVCHFTFSILLVSGRVGVINKLKYYIIMIKSFKQWINETNLYEESQPAAKSYASLAEYLKDMPNLAAKLSPQATHMISGTYFSMFGSNRVDLKLLNIATGAIVQSVGEDGAEQVNGQPDADNTIEKLMFRCLGKLLPSMAADVQVSSTQFPLAPGVTITGVKTSLDKTS